MYNKLLRTNELFMSSIFHLILFDLHVSWAALNAGKRCAVKGKLLYIGWRNVRK
jgi:hypothetical protein